MKQDIDSLSAEGAANMEDTFLIIDKAKLEELVGQLGKTLPPDFNIYKRAVFHAPEFSLPAVQAAAREYAEKRYPPPSEGDGMDDASLGYGLAVTHFIACFKWLAEQSKKGK